MPNNLTLKDVLISLLPPGSLWDLDEDGDFYKTLEASGDNHTPAYEFLKTLAYIREPLQTPILSDLEKEYGLLTSATLTEQERREYLHGVVYAPRSTGTHEYLQDQLQAAGFDVQVYPNSPAVDPARFYGGSGGEMVVNNVLYDRTITEARKFQELWSYVFFVGGDAVRDADGFLVAIAPVYIAPELKVLFRELILKYKPLHSWGIAVINAENDFFTFAPSDEAIVDAPRGFADDTQTTGGYWWTQNLGDVYLIDDITLELLVDDVTGDYLIEG
jgi:hypothetical protein